MTYSKLSLIFIFWALSACTHLGRSPESGYGSSIMDSSGYQGASSRNSLQDHSTRQTAYELGKDPFSLTSNDLAEIQARQKVRELERSLSSNKEREQYSKVLPWLAGDYEKIEFLSIPSIEGRQQWMNRKDVWSRSQVPQAEMKEMIDSQDIAVGMPQDYVKRSWGEPVIVEVSGNPIYKNERWKYQRFVSGSAGYRKETRFVYFEGGRVVGWETE